MADEHLNSVHLDMPRRQDFRRARELLLGARGFHTQALDRLPETNRPAVDETHTIIQHLPDRVPSDLDQWLMDQDAIYPLKIGVNTVGRLPDNDVVINGAYVSRRHCAILVHADDGCELHDIASKNGTYVNGQRLAGPTKLKTGDEIRMCDRQLVFCSRHSPNASPGPDRTMAE